MKLYLHIGTEKTGSSYLQSLSAINRGHLQQKGIWFPEAEKRDDMLLSGNISAGNAQDLSDNLNNEDLENCQHILSRHLSQAQARNCDSILLSNELMMIVLSKAKRLKTFKTLCEQCGFLAVEYLLIIRDPVEQALSLYKHRSKNGILENIELWPQKHYAYGHDIFNFLNEGKAQNIKLTCRKFSYQKNALENILYKDFLDIDVSLSNPKKAVNPSLTLSELTLLKKIKENQPYLVEILYDKLIKIKKEDKAENSQLEKYHKENLSNHLIQYQQTWALCNQYLPSDEKISYPEKVDQKELDKKKIYSFSEDQIGVVSEVIANSLSIKFKLKLETLKLKRKVGKWLR